MHGAASWQWLYDGISPHEILTALAVMALASSDARNIAVLATSSSVVNRRNGVWLMKDAFISSRDLPWPLACIAMAAVTPGASGDPVESRQFTRTPEEPTSPAKLRAKASIRAQAAHART